MLRGDQKLLPGWEPDLRRLSQPELTYNRIIVSSEVHNQQLKYLIIIPVKNRCEKAAFTPPVGKDHEN